MRMRKTIVLLLILICCQSYSQKLEPAAYARLNTFIHSGFEGNTFSDLSLGLSLFSTHWISPKIGFKAAIGMPEDNANFSEGTIEERIKTQYTGNLLTLGAKIRLTKPEDVWLYVWPEYSFGALNFTSSYYKVGDSPRRLALQEQVKLTENHSWLDLAVGAEFYFDSNERFLTSVYLVYTLMDIRSGFENLAFKSTSMRPISEMNSSIGFGVSIEYCFCKKQ